MGIVIENYLALNILDMVLVLISTSIILFIGKKYFWDILLKYFQRREQFIEDELHAARTNRQSSEHMLQEYRTQIKDAKLEASEIIEKAKHQAELDRKDIVARAQHEAELVKKSAQHQIERDREEVRRAIKTEISEVAFMAAKKIVEKELDETSYQKYVDEFIAQAGDQPWQA
ncbi:MAG: F0F1 ATP synthase subunit B [Erysipelotrichaceae bacterium]